VAHHQRIPGGMGLACWAGVISEGRPLFFFGIAGAVFTIIGLILGANVLYSANAGGSLAAGHALEKGILQTKI